MNHRMLILIVAILLALPQTLSAQTAEINTYKRQVREGSELLHKGDYAGARDSFESALRYYDEDASAYLGLGAAYFHLRDDRASERALRQALDRNPKEKQAYVVLGELAYRQDDLESAVAAWQQALDLDPADSQLKARLERVKREHGTEKDFNRDVTGHFSVKFEGRERIEAGKIVLRILEDAYGEIGRQLSYYPDREIAVILYSGEQFREVTDAPGWSGGIFDGKIRLPIGGIDAETPALRRLLYHEYTHAVVRSITPRVPTWLNEGLAQFFEGRAIDGKERAALQVLQKNGALPSLRTMEGSFLGLAGGQAQMAYLISLSAVRYMSDQYGVYRIRMILDELASKGNIQQAVETSLLVSYDEFESGWKRSLE
ncbi:MAG: tetratricopeptide repeat protein [Nitrospiraceae bacterium]|nr:tetratricopeptide repeat protein [Nitrospiraceae bacterium]